MTRVQASSGGFASATSELGAPLGAEIAGKYQRADDNSGIFNATVVADVALLNSDQLFWQQRYGLTDTFHDYSGVPVQGSYSLPGLPPRIFRTPVLSGNVTHTSFVGGYNMRFLRLQLALPGLYSVTLRTPDSAARADGGQVAFTSSVAQIAILSGNVSRKSTVVELGQPLPVPFVVRVTNSRGLPLAGKRVALVSAPRSIEEAASFLSRTDMLLPRFAMLRNAISTVTDYAGRAAFENVTVTASTISTVRLDFVCDGVRDPDAFIEFSVVAPRTPVQRAAAAAGKAPLPGSFADNRRIVMTIVSQPSQSVVEGTPLEQQPAVLVQTNETALDGKSWRLVPLPGAQVIALPFMQAGLRTAVLATPAFTKELGAIGGTPLAVLSNLAQQKLAFNFTSQPADATGIARWTGLGLTRHGPAGNYSFTFALANIQLRVETDAIAVASSVASVLAVQPTNSSAAASAAGGGSGGGSGGSSGANGTMPAVDPAVGAALNGWAAVSPSYNVTICNFPACIYYIGNPTASPVYMDSIRAMNADINVTLPAGVLLAPEGPSGYLPLPPALRVTDANGHVLAGKTVEPRVYRLLAGITAAASESAGAGTPSSTAGMERVTSILVREFPYRGASTTLLSRATLPAKASDDGVVSFLQRNIAAGDDAPLSFALGTGQFGSHFRFLTAPPGVTTGLFLVFAVDGVESAPAPLTITNLDVPTGTTPAGLPTTGRCAYLDIRSSPLGVFQNGVSIATGNSPLLGSPLAAVAVDSFGTPVQPLAPVQQHVTDFLGVTTITPLDIRFSVAPTPRYLAYLLKTNGAAFALGNRTAILYQQLLLPRITTFSPGSNGSFAAIRSGVQTSMQSYIRFQFASVVPRNPDDDPENMNSFPVEACVSTFSDPLPIVSRVEAVEWVDPPASSDNVTCSADGTSLISPLPQPVAYMRDGSIAQGMDSAGVLLAQFDSSFSTYPAGTGMTAREFSTVSVFQDPLDFPSIRLPGDPSASVMLPPLGDKVVMGPTNPLANLPFGSLAQVLYEQLDPTLPPQPPEPYAALTFFNMTGDAIPGSVVASLPPLAMAPGAPGTYNLVAYVQGQSTNPWTPMKCSDNASAVIIADHAPGAAAAAAFAPSLAGFTWTDDCPTPAGVFAGDAQGNVSRVASIPATPGCPNGCSGHGFCVCGVCVCRAPFDGSADCSVPYSGDSWGATFTSDAMYMLLYGGLPVWDVRAAIDHVAAASEAPDGDKAGWLYDVFPRFLLPAYAAVGSYSNITALLQYVASLASSSIGPSLSGAVVAGATSSSATASSMRLADMVSAALTAGAVPGATFTPSGLPQVVFPVLVTCDGQPVPDAYFTSVTPLLDRCADASYPLVSSRGFTVAGGNLRPPGYSDWDTYFPVYVVNNSSDTSNTSAFSPIPYADRRPYLRNVPTGCYRFKYVYAPQGQGSFSQHTMPPEQLIASGQAVSIGASRPFRVLSPVVGIEFAQWPSLYVPFDTPLPVPPVVRITLRTTPGNETAQLFDDCQLSLLSDITTLNSPLLARCRSAPTGGFRVYVSAVNYESGEVIPLYQSVAPNDCARAGNMSLITVSSGGSAATNGSSVQQQYLASFDGLTFPSIVELPPVGPGSVRGALSEVPQLRPGAYILRVNALGTTADSPFVVTVLASADKLEYALPPSMAAAGGVDVPVSSSGSHSGVPGIPAVVGVPIAAPEPIRIRALIDSTRGVAVPQDPALPAPAAQRYMAAPNVPITLSLVDGPLDSGAGLAVGTATAVTDISGIATFSNLALATGRSGVYVLLASASGITCNRTAHSIALNVSSPFSGIALTVNGVATFNAAAVQAAAALATTASSSSDSSSATAIPRPPLPGVAGTSAVQPITIDISAPVATSIKACVLPSGPAYASLVAGQQLRLATLLDTATGIFPGFLLSSAAAAAEAALTSQWQSDGNGTACQATYALPNTPYSVVATGQTGLIYTTDSRGCITLPSFVITGLSSSTGVALLISTGGLTAPPVHFSVLTPADAHPFRFSDLQGRIPIPFGIALPALLVNQVSFSPGTRLLVTAGAGVSLYFYWASVGAEGFLAQLASIRDFYTGRDASFVAALTAMYVMSIAAITVALAIGFATTLYAMWTHRRLHRLWSDVRTGAAACARCCCNSAPSPLISTTKASSTAGDTETSNGRAGGAPVDLPSIMPMEDDDDAISLSFATERHRAFLRYAAARRPRGRAPLLRTGEQQLSPHLIEALAHVFQRYADTAFADGAPIVVAHRRPESVLDGRVWRKHARLPGTTPPGTAASVIAAATTGALAAPGPAAASAASAAQSAGGKRASNAESGRTSIVQGAGMPRLQFVREALTAELAEEEAAAKCCCCNGCCGLCLACLDCRRSMRASCAAVGTSLCGAFACGRRGRTSTASTASASGGGASTASIAHDGVAVGSMAWRMTPTGAARLKAHLLRVHTGRSAAVSSTANGGSPVASAASASAAAAAETETLDLQAFIAVMQHRLARHSFTQVLADLRRCLIEGAGTTVFGSRSSIALTLAGGPPGSPPAAAGSAAGVPGSGAGSGSGSGGRASFSLADAAELLGTRCADLFEPADAPIAPASRGSRVGVAGSSSRKPTIDVSSASSSATTSYASASAAAATEAGAAAVNAPRRQLRFSALGMHVLAEAHRQVQRRLASAVASDATLRGAPAFMAVLDPPFARMWNRLFASGGMQSAAPTSSGSGSAVAKGLASLQPAQPPTLFDFISAYHERLLASCCDVSSAPVGMRAAATATAAVASPLSPAASGLRMASWSGRNPAAAAVAAAAGAAVGGAAAAISNAGASASANAGSGSGSSGSSTTATPLLEDSSIWQELDAWGFDGRLRHRVLDARGRLTVPVYRILAAAFAHASGNAASPDACLTWDELTAFRESVGMPPVRRDWFESVARERADASSSSSSSSASASAPAAGGMDGSSYGGGGSRGGTARILLHGLAPAASALSPLSPGPGGVQLTVLKNPLLAATAEAAGNPAPAATGTPESDDDEENGAEDDEGGDAAGELPGIVRGSVAGLAAAAASAASSGGADVGESRPGSHRAATALSQFGSSAAGDAAGAAAEPRVGPVGYAALAWLLHSDTARTETHLRRILSSLGYSDRLLWVGPAVTRFSAGPGGGSAELFIAADVVVSYAQTLVASAKHAGGHPNKATSASAAAGGAASSFGAGQPSAAHALASLAPHAVASARARLEAPVFLPQRMWVAVGVSLAMMASLTVLAFSLTDQLAVLVQTGVDDLTTLRSEIISSVDDGLVTTATLGGQYANMVLNGAAGIALAGPAAFTTMQITPASLAGLVSGKVSTVVQEVSIAADALNPAAGTAIGSAAAIAQVGLTGYLQAALSAATGIAGQLPGDLDALVNTGEAKAQQALGVQLSTLTQPGGVLNAAQNLLQSAFPGAASSAFVTQTLALTSPAYWQSLADSIKRNILSANVTGVVLATALVAATWYLMLRAYASRARSIQRGVYPFVYNSASVGSASRFVGIQATLVALSYIVTYAIIFIVYLLLSIPGVAAWLADYGGKLILSLLGVSLALRIVEVLLLTKILARGDTILYRRLYSLADLWISFLSTVTGAIIAVMRFVPFLPLAGLAIMRSDVSPLPVAYESYDSAKAVYNAVLLQASQMGNPLAYAFALAMMEVMRRRRARDAARGLSRTVSQRLLLSRMSLGGSAAAGNSGATSVVNPLRGAATAASAGASGAGEGEEDAEVAGVSPTAVVPAAVGAPGQGQLAFSAEDAAELRRKRVRNRWHMAVLLAQNPSLRALRVRDLPLRQRIATASLLFGSPGGSGGSGSGSSSGSARPAVGDVSSAPAPYRGKQLAVPDGRDRTVFDAVSVDAVLAGSAAPAAF